MKVDKKLNVKKALVIDEFFYNEDNLKMAKYLLKKYNGIKIISFFVIYNMIKFGYSPMNNPTNLICVC